MSTCRIEHDGGVCGARTGNALICAKDLGWLRDTLAALPDLLRELEVTITRQDRGTAAPLYAVNRSRVQRPGVDYEEGDTTLPSTQWAFSWDAANTLWTVRNTTETWARHLLESRGVLPLPDPPKPLAGPLCSLAIVCRHPSCRRALHVERTVRPRIARQRRRVEKLLADPIAFLLDHLRSIAQDEAGPEAWDELRAAARDVRQAIDRQEPDLFAGRCDAMLMTATQVDDLLVPELAPCGTDLMARTGDDDVKCPTCGTVYDLLEQRKKLDVAKLDAEAPVQVIVDGLSTAERPINASTLRTWIERDAKLVERDKEGPVCEACEHRTCEALRAAEIQALIRRHGRPLIPCRGWKDGKPVYRAGDVQARLVWNETQRGGRIGA